MDSKVLRYGTDRVRELLLGGKYRHQSLLRQRTVTDLTASRTSGRFCLAYGVGREIIMVHITLVGDIFIQAVYPLHPQTGAPAW